jgi:hypothetical protein
MAEKAANYTQAQARVDMLSMSHRVRRMTEQAVELRRAAAKASSRAERRTLDDEASDLFDSIYVELQREQPKGWLDIADAIDDLDALTRVRR